MLLRCSSSLLSQEGEYGALACLDLVAHQLSGLGWIAVTQGVHQRAAITTSPLGHLVRQ